MQGLTNEEILAKRHQIAVLLKTKYPDAEIIDSFCPTVDTDIDIGNSSIYYLGRSIQYLAFANLCYFVKGWEKYRGCVIEHDICKTYNIAIYEEAQDGVCEKDNEINQDSSE